MYRSITALLVGKPSTQKVILLLIVTEKSITSCVHDHKYTWVSWSSVWQNICFFVNSVLLTWCICYGYNIYYSEIGKWSIYEVHHFPAAVDEIIYYVVPCNTISLVSLKSSCLISISSQISENMQCF